MFEEHQKLLVKNARKVSLFLTFLVMMFTMAVLILGSTSQYVLKIDTEQVHSSPPWDTYKIYFLKICKTKTNGLYGGCDSIETQLEDIKSNLDPPISGLDNLKAILALCIMTGLSHTVLCMIGIWSWSRSKRYPKFENLVAFVSLFSILAAAIALPWIMKDYQCAFTLSSDKLLSTKINKNLVGLMFAASLFSIVGWVALVVETITNSTS